MNRIPLAVLIDGIRPLLDIQPQCVLSSTCRYFRQLKPMPRDYFTLFVVKQLKKRMASEHTYENARIGYEMQIRMHYLRQTHHLNHVRFMEELVWGGERYDADYKHLETGYNPIKMGIEILRKWQYNNDEYHHTEESLRVACMNNHERNAWDRISRMTKGEMIQCLMKM